MDDLNSTPTTSRWRRWFGGRKSETSTRVDEPEKPVVVDDTQQGFGHPIEEPTGQGMEGLSLDEDVSADEPSMTSRSRSPRSKGARGGNVGSKRSSVSRKRSTRRQARPRARRAKK
jgi:hypothetical protein